MARPMKPITCEGFLAFDDECAGRSFPKSKTTYVECEKGTVIESGTMLFPKSIIPKNNLGATQ